MIDAPAPPEPSGLYAQSFTGIDWARLSFKITVIENPLCTREQWSFPKSRWRSRRVHKKLLKRFGPQIVRVPAMFRVNIAGAAGNCGASRLLQAIAGSCR